MKKTRNILTAFFCLPLLVAGYLYITGDFAHVDMAVWADASHQTVFIVSTVMILLTLTVIPLSLRLFRFKAIHSDLLTRKATALKKWGVIRLLMLGVTLIANTFFYYAFAFESTFGYLAAIILLCFAFVIPTMNRCLSETEPDPEPEVINEDASEEEETSTDGESSTVAEEKTEEGSGK